MDCDLCTGKWECSELRFPSLALEHIRAGIQDWPASLPFPSIFEVESGKDGIRVHLYTRHDRIGGASAAWASLTRQHSRWVPTEKRFATPGPLHALSAEALLPVPAVQGGDPFLAAAAGLRTLQGQNREHGVLYIAVFGTEDSLQDRLRSLFAYATGTEKGVDDDTPNPWSLRLALWRSIIALGCTAAAIGGAAVAPGWIPASGALLAVSGGGLLGLCGFLGLLRWQEIRSIPLKIVDPRLDGALLKVGIAVQAEDPHGFRVISGRQRWSPINNLWPDLKPYSFPFLASDLTRLIAPLEGIDSAGLLARDAVDDFPAPPPAPALVRAPLPVGKSVVTGQTVGIDRAGHTLVVGGSRTGKSSAVFGMLKQIVSEPANAPGLFLVDPHASLSDAFLHHIGTLAPETREAAIERLRIITPHPELVVPLNPLRAPDFNWAGSALVLAGRRIWGDYWGPRMQAALLALCRLAHAWNQNHPGEVMGLVQTVFAAYDLEWRKQAAALLPPENRMTVAALDALLGQPNGRTGASHPGWVTEVVSPILSKVMSLELSPWLFSSMHAPGFVDLEGWIQSRAWIVLRLPSGEMGREAARLSAGLVYNIFEAAFRHATARTPAPYEFVIDEIQEIGSGMALESLLSEGGKFGARVTVLAQSLSMLRQMEGFEPVVQSLLANTSSQLFFSPDPDDADLLRRTLSLDERYGPTTMDIPSLQAWLRARLHGRWHPPARISVTPLPRPDPVRVARVINDVIDSHPESYIQGNLHLQVETQDPAPRTPHASLRSGQALEPPDHRKLGW